VPPELFEPWLGGATPPLCESLPPGVLPPPVPLDGVPLLGVWVPDDGGVDVPPLEGTGVTGVPLLGVPPPEPPAAVPPLFFAFLFFLVSPGWTGLPPSTGAGAAEGTVVLDEELLLPPLDATAITTIRKNATTASAMSRRRR
jgi:hypothetical protein